MFALMESGRRMPLDRSPDPAGKIASRLDPSLGRVARMLKDGEEPAGNERRYTSHFATCPNGDRHRHRKPAAPAHDCAWPGCETGAKPGQLMCAQHWYRVPKRLRDRIRAHYVPGQDATTCTDAYRAAYWDVLEYGRRRNTGTAGQGALL